MMTDFYQKNLQSVTDVFHVRHQMFKTLPIISTTSHKLSNFSELQDRAIRPHFYSKYASLFASRMNESSSCAIKSFQK